MSNSENVSHETTPTQEVLKKSNQTIDITDDLGRVIKVKKISVLRKMNLYEILGDLALNQVYMAHCIPLLAIVSIDGIPAPALASKMEMEAYLSQVEEDGLRAVMEGLVQLGVLPAARNE